MPETNLEKNGGAENLTIATSQLGRNVKREQT